MRKSFGDDGISKLRRRKDAGSSNAWIARSEKDSEVWALRLSVGYKAGRSGMVE